MGLIGYKETTRYRELANTKSKYESVVPKKLVKEIDAFLCPWVQIMLSASGSIDPLEAEAQIQGEIFLLRENILKNISQAPETTQNDVFQIERQRCIHYLQIIVRQWQTYDVERGYR